jgi:adenylate cyclase
MPSQSVQRRLAAIFAVDTVGFSRLMGVDEEGTLARLKTLRAEVVDPAIAAHHGRIFKTTGDGLLAEFPSVVAAVKCAAEVQIAMESRSAGEAPERRIVFRVGINLGDIIVEDDDIYGDGVNIAARIESICQPGGIAISASAYEQVRDKIDYPFLDCGEHEVKNIARPVHVYGVDLSAHGVTAAGSAARNYRANRRSWFWRITFAMVVSATAVGTWLATADSAKTARSSLAVLFGGKTLHPLSSRATIAVMPFSNQSGDTKRDYFSDGITEDIINALGRFSGVMVIARNTVQEYKGRSATRDEISRELGVRYIAQGSVRESDGKLRVAVELSDAEKGTQLWSDRYEGEGKEVFEIQDRIVKDIVGALAVKLTRLEQERIVAKPAGSLEAYDLVLRARGLLNQGARNANREARALLEEALKLAPNYAEAYVALAEAESIRSQLGWREDPEEGMKRSEELAKRALAIDDPGSNARAHAVLGRVNAFFGNYEQALLEANRATELNVSDSVAYALRGEVLLYLGRIEESIAANETARRFDPRIGADSGFALALAYYTAGRFRDAVAAADTFLGRYSENVFLHAVRAAALAQQGNAEEARKAAEQVRRFSPFFQVEVFGTRFVKPEHRAKIQEGLRKAGL